MVSVCRFPPPSSALGPLLGLLAWLAPALQSADRAAGAPSKPVDFAREIRPILSEKCLACHGPDSKKRKAKLRLDVREGVFRVEEGRAVTVPGKPEESHLYLRLTSTDPSERMPPEDSGKKPLSAEEVQRVRDWIAQGAAWKQHWAFEAPVRPALPPVRNEAWPRNEVDRFILARLEKEGLEPSPEADRPTIIRRVAFDLTGLPPEPEEVDAFVADARPDAYEHLVERLLKSPHHGEHMARFWLDAARYGDTHGLHLDNLRVMWPYRDWVIEAFNANMPYDRFAIEQLAGDLLPGATLEQQVASGFNRCHVTTSEGGVIEDEVYVRNVVDRVDTTGTLFLGMTVGCAVCHDHKYDPLSMKDYYSLFALFNSLDESPLDGNAAAHAPVVRVPTREVLAEIEGLRQQIAGVEREVREKAAGFPYAEPAGAAPRPPEPKEVVWIDDDLPEGSKPNGEWRWVEEPVASGKRAHAGTASGLAQHFFEGAKDPLAVAEGDALFVHVWIDPKSPPKEVMLQWNDGSWEHRAYWGENRIDWGQDGTPSRRRTGDLPEPGKWARLEVPAAQVGLAAGAKVHGLAFTQFDGTLYWDRAGTVTRDPSRLGFESFAAWKEALRGAPGSLPQEVRALLEHDPSKRGEDGERRLREHFIEHAYAPARALFEPLHVRLAEARKRVEAIERELPTTLVSKERAEPRPSYVLKRGQYDQRGEPVERATPAFLPPMEEGLPKDRLGFARWLVDPAHPLTARVAVNRLWSQVFGTGIVRTSEDFGSQGEPPVHPELLDWLATELAGTGWDVKVLLRKLVLSAAYRQSSRVTPDRLAKDPENRLLSRGPRFRLDAEMIRDQALAVGGLLVRAIGGPSVKPPQPAGLWEAVGYTGSNTARFAPDSGDKVRRRSLYTFWKRTAPPPQMATFDAPSREACRVRRERTNTPLQALQLMNEEQQVEAARNLAQRALVESGATPRERAARMFRLAAARPPDPEDLADMVGLYEAQIAELRKSPEAAKALLGVGETKPDPALDPVELAAWTMVGSLVLNLDEVVNKG
ncbi:MAG: PSD1 domain-containing protein [Planctomycetes bacterium]|nr:PSD1 domain-containing protein [Planctomycetota bacterium]